MGGYHGQFGDRRCVATCGGSRGLSCKAGLRRGRRRDGEVGEDGNVWVGEYNTPALFLVDGTTGAVLKIDGGLASPPA